MFFEERKKVIYRYAASMLVVSAKHPELYLAVSRKYDKTDFGLPGGKIDPGENFLDCAIRELFEETGLVAYGQHKFLFIDYCGIENYLNPVFIMRACGKIKTEEAGRVAWIPKQRFVVDGSGKKQAFHEFNGKMFAAINEIDLSLYHSNITLDEKDIVLL